MKKHYFYLILLFILILSCEDPNSKTDPLTSLSLPDESPLAIIFSDTDTDVSQYGGYITVQKASDESDITHYVIYAGSDSSTKTGFPLGVISKVYVPLQFFIPENTRFIPEVTHLLAFSANDDGLNETPASTPLIDRRTHKIEELKNPASSGLPAMGATIFMNDLVVTAVMAGSHFWVSQNTEFSSFYGGINIYCPGGNLPSQGDVITLSGTYQSFFGLKQIAIESYTTELTGQSPPVPIAVLPSEITTGGNLSEQYEGMLVTIENVTVTELNVDSNSPNFKVTGGLIVEDGIYSHIPTVNDTFQKITGILHFNHDEYRLYPRSAGDMVE